jgi:REP element-mobilizing transposase RayT
MICCFGNIVVGTGRDLSDDSDSNTGTGRDLSVQEPQMILNEYGKIADQQWHWLGEQHPYIILHEFIVMPNHIHGIIEINWVGTGHDLSLQQPKIKSLSELMGAYKTTTSKKIHLSGYAEFAWQRSFHDHIIRDEKSYERISTYIINNPNSWDQDKFFKM